MSIAFGDNTNPWKEEEMNELKTLKDFPKEVIGIEDKMISEKKLKTEAIKWLKQSGVGLTSGEFIEIFFNLTKEDIHNSNLAEGVAENQRGTIESARVGSSKLPPSSEENLK